MAALACKDMSLGEDWERFSLATDMNCDGLFTISDVGLWIHWIYFLPGDGLILLLLEGLPSLGTFFELGADHYGGWFSGIFSLFVWINALLMLSDFEEQPSSNRISPSQYQRFGSIGSFNEGVSAYNQGNYEEAVEIFRELAYQGNARAQHTLGEMYANGQGLPLDNDKAVAWWRKAAGNGHTEAQTNLGRMCAEGLGVLQDYAKAYIWFDLAAAQGYEKAAEYRDSIANLMTQEQIAEAHKRARELHQKLFKAQQERAQE